MKTGMRILLLACVLGLSLAETLIQEGIVVLGSSKTWTRTNRNNGRADEVVKTVDIKFTKRHDVLPVITTNVILLDASKHINLRYDIRVVDVSQDGFRLEVSSWASTYIYNLNLRWVSLGADHVVRASPQKKMSRDVPWNLLDNRINLFLE